MSAHFISGEFKSGIGSSLLSAAADIVLQMFLKTNKICKCLSCGPRQPTAQVHNLLIAKVPHTLLQTGSRIATWKNNSKRYTQLSILFHNFYIVHIIYKHDQGPHNTNWKVLGWRPMLYSVEEKDQHCRTTHRGADKSLARIDNSYMKIKNISCLSSP